MIKVLGAMLIVGSCSFAGFFFGEKYSGRVEQLRQLISALQMLQTEIGYTATPIIEVLPGLIQQTGPPVSLIFSGTKANLENGAGLTAGEAWQKALEKARCQLDLEQADLRILQRLSSSLGAGGREEHLQSLKLTQQQLSHQEREAAENRIKYERLYKTMGVLVGLALVLVFI